MTRLIAIFLFAAGALALARSERPWAGVAPLMVKVRPGQLPAGPLRIDLAAARGECEAAQIAVPAPAREVAPRASPLRAAGAAEIAPLLYREAFLDLAQATNAEGAAGLWPDALIPERDPYLHESRGAFPASSRGQEPVVAFYEVCVPRSAPPGTYRGEVELTAKGERALRIPVTLRVRAFELPATSTLPTSFGFSGLTACVGHHLETSEHNIQRLTRLYAVAALRHRLSLHGLTMEPPPFEGDPARPDFAAYDAEVGPLLDGTAAPDGARFTSTDVRLHPQARTDEQKVAYWRAFAAHLADKGWLSRAFVYAKDEPKKDELDEVRRFAQLVHRASPQLKVLVTAPLEPRLLGAADVFTPNLNCLFARGDFEYCRPLSPLAAYAPLRQKGNRLWWYQSCASHGCGPVGPLDLAARRYFSGWPSYMVDHDPALNRAMGVLAYLHGIEGELYFNTVEAYQPSEGRPADPWADQWRFHGNGDGTLFYPGTPERIGGKSDVPIASLRLALIRKGLEDYEYLALARKLGLESQAREFALSVASQPFEIARDPQKWSQGRERLAAQLEAAWRKQRRE